MTEDSLSKSFFIHIICISLGDGIFLPHLLNLGKMTLDNSWIALFDAPLVKVAADLGN